MVSVVPAEVRLWSVGAAPLVQVRLPYQEPPAFRTVSSERSGRPMMLSKPMPAERISGSAVQQPAPSRRPSVS